MALTPTPVHSASEFLPKLVTIFREGYRPADLRADALAGLTVAIVALPLSMAIAIASGVSPERGLFTTIIGGFISLPSDEPDDIRYFRGFRGQKRGYYLG